MKTIHMVYIAVFVIVVIGGGVFLVNRPAKQPQTLEVNDENCKVENVLKIEDSDGRQDFLKKCQSFAAMKKPLLPEVNTENCKPENIVKIEDMTARQNFREKCQAAGDAQARSGPLKWSDEKGMGFKDLHPGATQ